MLLNYTTKIPSEQTIGEIQNMLSNYNVSKMMTQYEGRNVSAVAFEMIIDGKPMQFKLPCNWRAVQQIFIHKNKNRKRMNGRLERLIEETDEQAISTSWRILQDWIEAQLALVEINMVTVPQIFLPYMVMKNGKTLAEHIETNPQFLLSN